MITIKKSGENGKSMSTINKELGKLISYGYDLNERDFKRNCDIPTFRFKYLGSKIPCGKKTNNGGIYGWRIYRDHSTDMLLTQIGVFEKKHDHLISYFLSTDNRDYNPFIARTKLVDNNQCFDYDNSRKYSENLTLEEFVEAMVMLGFNKEDVVAVAEGRLTAKEAYKRVAPDNLKNIEWLDIGRRKYVFDGNVAISGSFSGIDIDTFPFPFDGPPVLDCSKVSTWYVKFGDNKRGAKLINVNESKDSIRDTDLRAAIIDEPISLSLVDATNTIFGNQVVLNPEYSIAPLSKINLALAMDDHGKKYVTDINGHITNEWFPETEEVIINRNSKQIKVFSNADDKDMAELAFESGAEGIGLVRTENVFSNCTVDELRSFMYYYDWGIKSALDILEKLTKDQIAKIFLTMNGKRVIIRLLDFKFNEFLRIANMNLEELDFTEMPNKRGTKGLDRSILNVQLEVLMKLAIKYNVELNILVPMLDDISDFKYIRDEIVRHAQKYDITAIKIGAMVENLHSMNYADEIARKADFISIGTNDLTESIMGLSRDNQTSEFQILTDEVKKSIEKIIYKVRAVKPEIEIGICGEHANYVDNLEFLAGLNIDYVTCAPAYVRVNQELLNRSQQRGRILQIERK